MNGLWEEEKYCEWNGGRRRRNTLKGMWEEEENTVNGIGEEKYCEWNGGRRRGGNTVSGIGEKKKDKMNGMWEDDEML